MSDVVDDKVVAVTPVAHVIALERGSVVVPERLVGDVVAKTWVEGHAPNVKHQVHVEGLDEGALEVELVRLGRRE